MANPMNGEMGWKRLVPGYRTCAISGPPWGPLAPSRYGHTTERPDVARSGKNAYLLLHFMKPRVEIILLNAELASERGHSGLQFAPTPFHVVVVGSRGVQVVLQVRNLRLEAIVLLLQ